MNQLTLGADPEVFLEDNTGNLQSAIGLIGGSKQRPRVIDDHGDFKIQEDNVAAEYNIPASFTKEKFIQHILWPQQYIAQLIQNNNYKISKRASGQFNPKQLNNKKAREFGCDPDFNAWTLRVNEKPRCEDPTFRTAGGHIHLGLEDKSDDNIIRIIRAMDKTLGVWSVIADSDQERRQLYGKAGCFRPQDHGLEYRTLSNFWIFSKELISEVWDRTLLAVNHPLIELDQEEAHIIQDIINTGNINGATSYLQANGLS